MSLSKCAVTSQMVGELPVQLICMDIKKTGLLSKNIIFQEVERLHKKELLRYLCDYCNIFSLRTCYKEIKNKIIIVSRHFFKEDMYPLKIHQKFPNYQYLSCTNRKLKGEKSQDQHKLQQIISMSLDSLSSKFSPLMSSLHCLIVGKCILPSL